MPEYLSSNGGIPLHGRNDFPLIRMQGKNDNTDLYNHGN